MSCRAVLCLRRLDQLSSVLSCHPELLAQTELLSLDIDVSAKLESLQIPFREPQDFLSLEECMEIRKNAHVVMDNWFSPFHDLFQYGGLSLASLNRVEWRFSLQDMLLASRLFQRVQQILSPSKLFLFQENRRAVVYSRTTDLLEPIWEYLAEKQGIAVHHLPAEPRPKEKAFLLRDGWPSTRRLVQSWTQHPFFRITRKKPLEILFLMGLGEFTRYGRLFDELKEHYGDGIQAFRAAPLVVSNIKTPGGHTIHSLASFLPGRAYLSTKWRMRRAWNIWRTSSARRILGYAEIFENPRLDFHFQYFFRNRWPIVAEYLQEALETFQRLRPRLLVTTCLGVFDHGHVFIEAAKKLNIKTVTLPHTIVPDMDFPITVGDYSIVWSREFFPPKQSRVDDRWKVVGVPHGILFEAYSYLERKLPDTLQKISRSTDKTKTVLVLASAPAFGALPDLDRRLHRETIYQLVDLPAHLHGRVRVVLKTHPAYDYSTIYELAKEKAGNGHFTIVSGAPLNDLIMEADVCVVVNIPTTALYVSLLHGKPTLHLHTAKCFPTDDWAFLQFSKKAIVTEVPNIWPRIEQVLFDDRFRFDLLREHSDFEKAYLKTEGDPIGNIKKFLDTLLR